MHWDPIGRKSGRRGMLGYVRAMAEPQRWGEVVFGYGDNILPRAHERGIEEAFEIGIFTELCLKFEAMIGKETGSYALDECCEV